MFDEFGVSEIHRISSPDGRYQAVVAPQGAALKTLTVDGTEIVVVPQPVSDFSFAGSTLAPWPNRLEDCSWKYFETELQGEITEPKNHNGLHGLLVKRDFDVLTSGENAVTYGYLLGADSVYPFVVQLFVKYELTNEGLKVTTTAQNQGEEPYPFGFGVHPYFALDAESTFETSAHLAKLNNERQLPIGETQISTLGIHTGKPVLVSDLKLDDCIYDFEVADSGLVETKLTRPNSGQVVEVWQEPGLAYQMLFTRRPRLPGEIYEPTIAIEPQTSPANAFRTGEGLLYIYPGDLLELTWGIRVS